MSNHTGDRCPQSGIYRPSTGGKEVAMSRGDVFPPSGGKGADYTLVRPTR